jgi:uncharacterized protein YukE
VSDVLHYSFENIEGHLASLGTLNTAAMTKKEELQAEMQVWASYWQGQAHQQATDFTNHVAQVLHNVIEASQAYISKAHLANEDMRSQELTNSGMWV